MAIVGTAYVEVRAVTNKVRQEVQSGFQRGVSGVGADASKQIEQDMLPGMEEAGQKSGKAIEKELAKSGDNSAKSFTRRFDTGIRTGVRSVSNTLSRAMSGSGGDSGRRWAQKFYDGADSIFKKVPIGKIALGGLVALLPQAIALVGQLSGGLFSLASAAGQSVGAIGPLYSTMVPLVSIMGGVKLGLSGVGQAVKDLMSGNATPQRLKQDLAGLSPAADKFAHALAAMKPKLKELKQTAGSNLLPGLTAGMKAAMPLFEPFRKMIGNIDHDVGMMAKHLGQALGGPLRGLVSGIFTRNAKSVHNLTGAFVPLVKSLLRIYAAMQPVQNQFTHLIKQGSQWLNLWTSNNRGTMESYFQRSFDRMKQLGSIVLNLVKVVLNTGHAASQAGGTMLDSIDRVTGGWAKLTGQVGTQNKMAKFFQDTVPIMKTVAGIIGDILKGIVSLGGGDKSLEPILLQVRNQLMPALGQLFRTATGPLAIHLVNLLTGIAKVLAKLSDDGASGFLDSFAVALTAVVSTVSAFLAIPGVGKMAGYLLGIAGAVAAYGKVISLVKGFSLASKIEGLGLPGKGGGILGGGGKLGSSLSSPVPVFVTNWKGGVGGGVGGPGKAGESTAEQAGKAASEEAGASVVARGLGRLRVGFQEGLRRGVRGLGVALAGDIVGNVLQQHGHRRLAYATKNATSTYGALAAAGPEVAIPATAFVGLMSLLPRNRSWTKGFTQQEMTQYNRPMPRVSYQEQAKTQVYLQAHPDVLAKYHTEMPHFNQTQLIQYVAGLKKLKQELRDTAAATDHSVESQKRSMQTGQAVVRTTDNFRKSLKDLKASVAENGQALTGNSTAARNNQMAMIASVNTIKQHMQAMKDNGASSKEMTQDLYKMATQLHQQASASLGSKKAVDAFMQQVGLMPNKIKRTLAGIKAMALAAGGDLGNGFVLGMQQKMGAVSAQAKVMADQAIKDMRFSLQSGSPSRRAIKVGKEVVDGFVGGIAAGQGRTKQAAEAMAEASLAGLYKSVDKIVTGLRARRQAIQQAFNVLGQSGGSTGVTSILQAVQGGPHAVNREERAIRQMWHREIQTTQNMLRTTLHSEDSRAATLRREIANAKTKKTQQGYIADLAKIEQQRKKVIDLRDALNRREDKAQKYLSALNDRLDRLATQRQKIADKLSKAQSKLAGLRDAKASIESTIRSGIASFTDVTGVVPQGVPITAARVVSGIQGRLRVVKQWAADIKTLIKRGLNHTMISEIINQGPDVGGQYAHALVQATADQIGVLNKTQKQITAVSNNLATYVGDQFYNAGIKAADGLVKGLKRKQRELDAAAEEMGRRMAKALKQALGIKSPSAVMRDEIGQYIPLGIAAGIHKTTPRAVAAIHQMNRKLMAASQTAMSPSLLAQQTASNAPTQINGPLLAVEHLHVRDDQDITKVEQMLYQAHRNISRASGKRQVVPTT